MPMIRPAEAITAPFMPYFPKKSGISGVSPAPLNNMALPGRSPCFFRSIFTGLSLSTSMTCFDMLFTISAVNFASEESVVGRHSFSVMPSLCGSVSVMSGERPLPLKASAARCPVDLLKILSTPGTFTFLVIVFARSFVSCILPARLSFTIPFSTVAKLHLNAISPCFKSIPTPAASSGPRPV